MSRPLLISLIGLVSSCAIPQEPQEPLGLEAMPSLEESNSESDSALSLTTWDEPIVPL